MGLVSSSVVRGHQRTRPMTSTLPVEESNGKAYVVGQWEAGLWQRSRVTERSPTGRLTLWDNGKLGLGCIDRGKKHDLG